MSTNMELATEFANKVRVHLRHLTSEQISDLTDGLEADIASSLDDGAEIGSAEEYASDLLSAAGLEVSDVNSSQSELKRKVEESIRAIAEYVRRNTSGLAPAWWVFRAWVVTQLIGFFLFHEATGSPASYEWNRRPLLGYFVLIVLTIISVLIGRKNFPKLKSAVLLSHVVVALAAVFVMFSSPRTHEWFVYQSDGSYPTTTVGPNFSNCPTGNVPDVVGLSVIDAKKLLEKTNWPYDFFDKDTMVEMPDAPDRAKILQIETRPSNDPCLRYYVQLVVDLAKPSIPDSVMATTTTTVKPKATTTTKP